MAARTPGHSCLGACSLGPLRLRRLGTQGPLWLIFGSLILKLLKKRREEGVGWLVGSSVGWWVGWSGGRCVGWLVLGFPHASSAIFLLLGLMFYGHSFLWGSVWGWVLTLGGSKSGYHFFCTKILVTKIFVSGFVLGF